MVHIQGHQDVISQLTEVADVLHTREIFSPRQMLQGEPCIVPALDKGANRGSTVKDTGERSQKY